MYRRPFATLLKQNLLKIRNGRAHSSQYTYEMPELIKNSFFLANASLFNSANWFIHRAYEVVFNDLIADLKAREPSFDDKKAKCVVLNIIKVLEPCNAVVDLRYPIIRENGDYSIIRGFRVQHGKYRPDVPCLGGLTISNNVCKDMMKALAALATYKYACFGIDVNGSHGGIQICKTDYTENELKDIVQTYIVGIVSRGSLGESLDAIEPDCNVGYTETAWMCEADAKVFDGSSINACIMGKPSFSGGLENYEMAGAHCIHFGLKYFLTHKNIVESIQCESGLQNKTFVIQGIGKLGSQVAHLMENAGAKCVGVKEQDAYVYDRAGISVKEIVDYKKNKGGIEYFSSKTKPRQDNEILTEECDILILSAKQKTLSCYTAPKVKAKVIVEAAQGAISPSAHQILIGHKKLVLPDIFITCGFSLASHFEYLKNAKFASNVFSRSLTRDVFKDLLYNIQTKAKVVGHSDVPTDSGSWNEARMVFEAMEYIMDQTARNILKKMEKYNLGLDIRTAAYIKAIQNLFKIICDAKIYDQNNVQK